MSTHVTINCPACGDEFVIAVRLEVGECECPDHVLHVRGSYDERGVDLLIQAHEAVCSAMTGCASYVRLN